MYLKNKTQGQLHVSISGVGANVEANNFAFFPDTAEGFQKARDMATRGYVTFCDNAGNPVEIPEHIAKLPVTPKEEPKLVRDLDAPPAASPGTSAPVKEAMTQDPIQPPVAPKSSTPPPANIPKSFMPAAARRPKANVPPVPVDSKTPPVQPAEEQSESPAAEAVPAAPVAPMAPVAPISTPAAPVVSSPSVPEQPTVPEDPALN